MEDKINILLTLFASCRTPATRALSLIRSRVELKALLLSVRKSVMALNYNSKFLLQQERFLFLCLLVLAIIIADNKHSWLNWTRVSRDICPVFSFGHSTVHLKYLLISSSYWTSFLRSLPVAVNCLDACRWLLSPKLETCSSRWCGKTERTNDLLSMLIVYAEVRWYALQCFHFHHTTRSIVASQVKILLVPVDCTSSHHQMEKRRRPRVTRPLEYFCNPIHQSMAGWLMPW